jgi:4-hydroxymandelate synthase
MNVQGIDHLEFYVADVQEAAGRLCTAYGFAIHGVGGPDTGLAGQRSVLVRLRGIQILLTSAVSDSHPAADFVRRHGDGVAVIALGTDDAVGAFTQAAARGATPVAQPVSYERGISRVIFAAVSGFGDVTHRFVERHGPAEDFAPGLIKVVAPDAHGGDGGGSGDSGCGDLIDAIDHIAACVPAGQLETVIRFYDEVFGFAQIFEEKIEVGSQAMDSKVVQDASGTVTFTFLEPLAGRDPGQIDAFLRSHGGAGVQHVAFRTVDIGEAVRAFEKRGVRFLAAPPSYYGMLERRLGMAEIPLSELRDLNVLVDRDQWGLMFQIFSQSVHPRRTFFFELIERRGALTFGSGNIRALYEAVAREQAVADPAPIPIPGPGAALPHS